MRSKTCTAARPPDASEGLPRAPPSVQVDNAIRTVHARMTSYQVDRKWPERAIDGKCPLPYRSRKIGHPEGNTPTMADSAAPDALLTPAEGAALSRVTPKTATGWARAGMTTALPTR